MISPSYTYHVCIRSSRGLCSPEQRFRNSICASKYPIRPFESICTRWTLPMVALLREFPTLVALQKYVKTFTLSGLFSHHRLVVSILCKQWCGGAEGETEPLTSRLVDFARMRWTNPAFRQMMTAFFCTPGADLCETENAVSTVGKSIFSLLGNCGATAIRIELINLFATN